MSSDQMLMFPPLPPTEAELMDELAETKEQLKKVRRGLFQRYNLVASEITLMKELMQEICERLDINCDTVGKKT